MSLFRKLIFLLAFFFLSSIFSTFSQGLEEAEELYEKGKEALLKEDYKKANEFFRKAEEFLKRINEKKKIENNERRKKKDTPQKIDKSKLLREANKAYKENDLNTAFSLYKQLLRYTKRNSNLHYNLGVICLKRKKYNEAAKEFEEAIRINPRNADAYYNLGVLYESFLSDKEKAASYYKKYLRFSQDKDREKVKEWIKYLEE